MYAREVNLTFSGINGHGCGLWTNPQAKAKPSNEHVPPCVGKGLPKASQGGENTGEEDSTTTAKPFVERNGQPATNDSAAEIRR